MKRYLALALLLIAVPAEAKFRTVSEWASMPPDSRTFYVAGVRDFLAAYASYGRSPAAARIHTCLGAERFAAAETADFLLEWTKLRKDAAESNAAGFVISYLRSDCRSPSADIATPAKAALLRRGFTTLTPHLQADYVEAVQDSLVSFSGPGDGQVSKFRQCLTQYGLIDAKGLASAAIEYAQLNERRIEPDASFAKVTLYYLASRCK